MKTTIQIPQCDLQELIQNTKAKTKKEAVLTAIKDYNKRQRMLKLSKMLGTFEDFMTPEDLEIMRKDSPTHNPN